MQKGARRRRRGDPPTPPTFAPEAAEARGDARRPARGKGPRARITAGIEVSHSDAGGVSCHSALKILAVSPVRGDRPPTCRLFRAAGPRAGAPRGRSLRTDPAAAGDALSAEQSGDRGHTGHRHQHGGCPDSGGDPERH